MILEARYGVGNFLKNTGNCQELFLGIEKGSELPRTDVTRRLNVYIKEKQLQNPENKKNIIPDAPLKTLLRLEATDVLSYFNLQRYMKHLFVQLWSNNWQVK